MSSDHILQIRIHFVLESHQECITDAVDLAIL